LIVVTTLILSKNHHFGADPISYQLHSNRLYKKQTTESQENAHIQNSEFDSNEKSTVKFIILAQSDYSDRRSEISHLLEDGQDLEFGHSTSDTGKSSAERSHANNIPKHRSDRMIY
jgi:hypothetical protein